ncbi:DUF4439 domain-containing protein [Corynebacterium alimapuense]|uniref:DUF4439 domain-containing protein n=1 Tax=Corynebacterium alimapuense TaxID=1576874 RepID=A0A3M8K836_9CORY|nr:DUF4439 domain-containing protein [Corynebacterium alimapuense]RNE49383.1 hypothetical protein C5L39_03175 [Corynebacterium alimapuense]
MNRRLATIAIALAVSPLLASCTIEDTLDFFGPKPNQELASLADQATLDTEQFGAVSELRQRHTDELSAEIIRLCGVFPNGTIPESCEFVPDPTQATGIDLEQSLALTLEAAEDVPEESVALVTRQAVDLARVEAPSELPVAVDPERSSADARLLLEREYAVVYGLGVARAFISFDRLDALDALAQTHVQRISALREALVIANDNDSDGDSEIPVAEAGYEFNGIDELSTAKEAEAFVDRIESDLAQDWLAAAVDAQSPDWREWLVAATAHSELATEAFLTGN